MRDNRWILAVAARCALYALFSGAVFVMVCAATLTALFLLAFGVGKYLSEGVILSFIYGWWILALVSIGIGAIGGAVAGFYSPPREGAYPFHSPFFQCVVKNGVRGFFAGAFLGVATELLCFPILGGNFLLTFTLILTFGGQIYGLGRGLNRARCAAPALPTESA